MGGGIGINLRVPVGRPRLRRICAKYLLFSADYSGGAYQFEPEGQKRSEMATFQEVSWSCDEKGPRSLARSTGRNFGREEYSGAPQNLSVRKSDAEKQKEILP
jgi:hypothetical protein